MSTYDEDMDDYYREKYELSEQYYEDPRTYTERLLDTESAKLGDILCESITEQEWVVEALLEGLKSRDPLKLGTSLQEAFEKYAELTEGYWND